MRGRVKRERAGVRGKGERERRGGVRGTVGKREAGVRGKGERERGGERKGRKREREGERKGRKEREEGWEGKAEEREEGRAKEVVHETSNSRVLPSSPCCWLAPDQCRENINWFKFLIP